MNDWLSWLWFAVLFQRLIELGVAQKNARWLKEQGGYEVGRKHYPLIVGVHGLFFVGILSERVMLHATPPSWWEIPFFLFLMAQALRAWCIVSLGSYWNTRIWIVPGHVPLVRGPYRYLRHPNYVVVMIEIITLPLVFGAYITAGVISLFNAIILLGIRIPAEERALKESTCYEEVMAGKHRFFP